MNALEWLKRRHAASEENRRRTKFESVPASQAWGGYADKPRATWTNPDTGLDVNYGGQQLMVRQPVARQPEVDNTLTVKNDGTRTLVKKWKDPDQSNIKISAVPRDRSPIKQSMIPPPRNQRNPFDIPEHMFPQGLSPEAQAAIAQVQATGGQNVDAYGDPIGIGENTNQAGGWARTSGMWDVPAKAQSMATPRVSDFQPDRDAMAFAKDRERRTAYLPERQVRVTDFQPDVIDRRQPTVPRETWGGDLNLTLPQHPRTRRWIQDPATILNIGNLIKKMGGTIDYMKGIDDRIKENRDRRFRMFQGDPYSPVRKY